MAAWQACVDCLLSAGGSYVPGENGPRLFYIDQGDGEFVLSYRDRIGTSLGPPIKVIDGVKQSSSAAYLFNKPKPSLILCVSPSSTLRALEFNKDEDKWVDSTSFNASINIHPSGQFAATNDERGNSFVFFQDPTGRLTLTQGSESSSNSLEPLPPVNAVSATPLSATFIDENVTLFYIAQDTLIHYLTNQNGKWVDAVLAQKTFKQAPKRFLAFAMADDDIVVLGISENSALVLITSNGDKTVLGKVDSDGTFTPGTTEECGAMVDLDDLFRRLRSHCAWPWKG